MAMTNQFARTQMLIGDEAIKRLQKARVIVFGVGGVGGYVVEALARAGVGSLELVDNDMVSLTNLNRQILALHSTIGKKKTDVAKARILDINPNINVVCHDCFYLPETADTFDFSQYDYVVDAIDTVAGKIALAEQAHKVGTPIIASMGTGNKLNAGALKIVDINKTSVCPLAKVMRKELRLRGIHHLKTICSTEAVIKQSGGVENGSKRAVVGSISYVPAVAGLLIAGEVIQDLINGKTAD